MIERILWTVLALPLDLLVVFGFERLAMRIAFWRLVRTFRNASRALNAFGLSNREAAKSFERLGSLLLVVGDVEHGE
jgi:hypothetical protein